MYILYCISAFMKWSIHVPKQPCSIIFPIVHPVQIYLNWDIFRPLTFFVGSTNPLVMFSFISSSSILVPTITNFGFSKSKIPFHIFPHQSLFRHFKHVYGLIFKHESVFWKRPQRFYAERICLKIKSSQEQPDHGHTVKCTLCMKMSTSTYIRIMIFRNVNSLNVFSERNFV